MKRSARQLTMRRVYVPVMLLLFLGSLASAQTRSDGGKDKPAGPVHTVRVESAPFSGEPGKAKEGPRRVRSSFSYDTMGNLTEAIHFEKSNTIISKRVVTYNPAGAKTEEANYKAKGDLSSRKVFILDGSGRVTEMDEYDDKGQVTGKTFFTYDAAGKLAEKRLQDKDAKESITQYKYDSQGRVVEQSSLDDKKNLTHKIVYIYGSDVARVESTTYKDQKAAEKVFRVHNAQAHKTTISYHRADGVMAWQRNFTYDDKSNVVGDEYKSEAFYAKWDYAYEFDAMGNWTKQMKSRWYRVSGKPTSLPQEASYRSISYYPQAYTRSNSIPADVEESSPSYVLGGVLQGEAIQRVEPAYPPAAKAGLIRGAVQVEVTVDEEGNVTNARIISGQAVFHEACLSAASKWKFIPTLLSGLPVKVVGAITFNFSI